jgi:hypothetical protein
MFVTLFDLTIDEGRDAPARVLVGIAGPSTAHADQ